MTTTHLRTAGIWIDDGFILLSRGTGMHWGVPGGGLEPDETVEAGCLREYQEEMGLTMQTHGMALILEHFWSSGAGQKRAYEFYFWVQPADGLVLSRADVRGGATLAPLP